MASWSTRTSLLCHATLSVTEPYLIKEGRIHVRPNGSIMGFSAYYLDLEHEAELVEDAFVRGTDLLDAFLDALALVSFGGALRSPVVSRTPLVTEDSPGLLATLGTHQSLSPVEVLPADLVAYSDNVAEGSPTAIALRHLRDALAARHSSGAQQNYRGAIEAIAASESEERVQHTCPTCSAVREGDIATQPLIRRFFEEYGSNRWEANEQRVTRSKTVHGAGLRDVARQIEVGRRVAAVEPIAMQLLADRSGLTPATHAGLVVGFPVAVYDLFQEAGELKVRAKSWESTAAFTQLPREKTLGRHRRVEIGISQQPDERTAELGAWDSTWASEAAGD